jgi:hypothetical protein
MSVFSKKLVERYVRAAWILKIRLMSARRHLWDQQTSLIHIENSVLQLRKACESICHMCLIAAELDLSTFSQKLYSEHKVGKVFRCLANHGADHFPRRAELTLLEKGNKNSKWQLVIEDFSRDDLDRVVQIFNRSGNVLHENFLYQNMDTLTPLALGGDLNGFRGDHQWLWNRFWQTSANLRGALLFVSLGDDSSASQPKIIKEANFLQEDVELEFDPDVIADFSGMVEWVGEQSANGPSQTT